MLQNIQPVRSGLIGMTTIAANYRHCLLLCCCFLIWKVLTDFLTCQEETTLPPCSWYWTSEITHQGTTALSSVMLTLGALHRHQIRLQASTPFEQPPQCHRKPCCLSSAFFQRNDIKTLRLVLSSIWSKQCSKHTGLQEGSARLSSQPAVSHPTGAVCCWQFCISFPTFRSLDYNYFKEDHA